MHLRVLQTSFSDRTGQYDWIALGILRKCLTTLHPSEYHRLLTSRSREPKHKILVFNGKLFSGKCTYTSVLDLKLRDVLLPCFPESNPKQWKRRDNVSGWGRKKKLFFKKQLMPKIRAPWFHLFNTDALWISELNEQRSVHI